MIEHNPLYAASALGALFFWTISYVLIIRRSHLDRTWGVPFPALCLNLAYESVFGFIHPLTSPGNYMNVVWFLVDLVIAAQFLRHGRAAWPAHFPKQMFLPAVMVCLAMAMGISLAVTADMGLHRGNSYLGWGSELVMDALLLAWLHRREGVEGQSLWIGVSHVLGTMAIIPAQELEVPLSFVRVCYFSAAVLNLTYLYLYVRKCRTLGIAPLRRL